MLIKPKTILTLGDYYNLPGVRQTLHDFQDGIDWEVSHIARLLSPFVKYKDVLIPVPSENDIPTKICIEIMRDRYCSICNALIFTESHLSNRLYEKKKQGVSITEDMVFFGSLDNVPNPINGGRVILVDDVIGTGTTISKCLRIINAYSETECDTVLCVAVDYKTYTSYE